jgi:hypothetical protein
MVFVSATRLRVRSIKYLLGFFKANEASVKELSKSKGFLGGKELVDKHFTFWTLTLWDDMENMKGFRNSEAHRKAMQKLPFWCDEASYVHWLHEDLIIPSWDEIYQKLIAEGKITKVRKPSAQQSNKNYPPPKWKKIERTFKKTGN